MLIKKERMVLSNECEVLRAGFWIKEAIRSLREWITPSPQLWSRNPRTGHLQTLRKLGLSIRTKAVYDPSWDFSLLRHSLRLQKSMGDFLDWWWERTSLNIELRASNMGTTVPWRLNLDNGKITIRLAAHPEILKSANSSLIAEGQPTKLITEMYSFQKPNKMTPINIFHSLFS